MLIKKIIFNFLFTAVRLNRNIVAVCPEKNKSFVIGVPVPTTKISGSIRSSVPSGGSRGTTYIEIILNKFISMYAWIATKKYCGYLRRKSNPVSIDRYIRENIIQSSLTGLNRFKIGSLITTPGRCSMKINNWAKK